jgi:LAS superfamily LD-carboxypeptidase LdcB/YHS domain-containing protein
MKRFIAGTLAILLLFALWMNRREQPPTPATEDTYPTQTVTEAPLRAGWQIITGERYCFSQEGAPLTGWYVDGPERYYLDSDGRALTGWQEIDGRRYHFEENAAMTTGWLEKDGKHYYFGVDGILFTGLLNIQGKGYYFSPDGSRYSGWLEKDGKTYYFGSDGIMAVGAVEIDGALHHFSPHGVKILLVNPWNSLPGDYAVELVNVTDRDRLETDCAEALERMLADCRAAGYSPFIVSAYRTQEEQDYLYQRKIQRYLDAGWSEEDARKDAAKEVAVPGTSEHQLGLAVDLIDANYGYLDEHQAQTGTQKWLMAHCHEYGFILRYPVGSTEITGIIYEPWHYRYVGVEIAQEIMNLGITLEEYLGAA